ncbi:hypothetical protein Fmac_009618 [Flemingia macrophylla]|uniref:Uncharacterized protein n=1 Tax=Flemingia macrophylla TaxID=520843 RepID=A0ABD1N0V6_9FABA
MVVFKLQLLGEICTQTSIGNYIFCTSNNLSICLSYSQLCELSFHRTRHLRNPYNESLPVKEEFAKIFSQVKSEAASCGGGSECSPLDPNVEEKIRNQS